MIKIIKELEKSQSVQTVDVSFLMREKILKKMGFWQITQCLLGKLGLYVHSAVKKLY